MVMLVCGNVISEMPVSVLGVLLVVLEGLAE